jgi:hypothetical protein
MALLNNGMEFMKPISSFAPPPRLSDFKEDLSNENPAGTQPSAAVVPLLPPLQKVPSQKFLDVLQSPKSPRKLSEKKPEDVPEIEELDSWEVLGVDDEPLTPPLSGSRSGSEECPSTPQDLDKHDLVSDPYANNKSEQPVEVKPTTPNESMVTQERDTPLLPRLIINNPIPPVKGLSPETPENPLTPRNQSTQRSPSTSDNSSPGVDLHDISPALWVASDPPLPEVDDAPKEKRGGCGSWCSGRSEKQEICLIL